MNISLSIDTGRPWRFDSVDEFDAFCCGWRMHELNDSRRSVEERDTKNAEFHKRMKTKHWPMIRGYDARSMAVAILEARKLT